MTTDDIDDGLPRLPIFDGTKQPQHRPAPSKLTLPLRSGRDLQHLGEDSRSTISFPRAIDGCPARRLTEQN